MTTQTRVNELDLLRFLSAMAVVVYHYTFLGPEGKGYSALRYVWAAPMTQYASYGVELFFMISGFVILMTAGSGGLRAFAISRAVRLYPAFWACCTITFVAILWMGAPLFTATVPQYALNMSLLNEFFYVDSIDGVYWTLAVELRFYLLIAVVLAFGQIHRIELLLALWLALCVVMEFKSIDAIQRIFITAHAGFFVTGAVCYLVWACGVSPRRLALLAASWLLVVYQAVRHMPKRESSELFSLDPYVVVSIISGFFLVMLLISLKKTGPLRQQRWVLAGALTYPLYLVHQYVGYMIINRFHLIVNAYVLLAGTIAFMLLLSYAVHVVFEKRLARQLKTAIQRGFGGVKPARALSTPTKL